MSFKEVLEIIPKMNDSDLKKMEKSLSSRFMNAAKSFGHGLMNAIKGGAVATLLEKFLNPLQDIQQSIDRTLDKGASLSAQAKQFGASSGELAKLHAFGSASGVDDQSLNLLIEKFQIAVTNATQNPGEHSAVRQFAGQTNAVTGFWDFIQNLKKLEPIQQHQVEEEVFGAKQILKMSEFLHADFGALSDRFKDIKVDKLTHAVDDINEVAKRDQANKAHSSLKDLISKDAAFQNSDVAGLRNKAEEQALARENDRITRFKEISNASLKIDKIQEDLEKLVSTIITQLPIILDSLTAVTHGTTAIVDGIGNFGHKAGQVLHWMKTHTLFGGKIKGK